MARRRAQLTRSGDARAARVNTAPTQIAPARGSPLENGPMTAVAGETVALSRRGRPAPSRAGRPRHVGCDRRPPARAARGSRFNGVRRLTSGAAVPDFRGTDIVAQRIGLQRRILLCRGDNSSIEVTVIIQHDLQQRRSKLRIGPRAFAILLSQEVDQPRLRAANKRNGVRERLLGYPGALARVSIDVEGSTSTSILSRIC